MTIRVGTVLSAREWESRLVATARTSAGVRLVLRAFLPDEVGDRAGELDVVVVGSETPWATPARLSAWSRAGLRVVVVHPAGDRPAAQRLGAAGADLVLADDLPADTILREIRLLEPAAHRSDPSHPLFAVTGARGAPGRTEVAVGVAWIAAGAGDVVLVDADLEAPGVAVRLAVPPRPDLADAIDAVHATGAVPDRLLQPLGRLRVLPGAHRPGEPPLRAEPVYDVVDALRTQATVVVDTGPWPNGIEVVKAATTALVVVDASPTGVVRAAGLLGEWAGPLPTLILNRTVEPSSEIAGAIRRWTGLEPERSIPFHPSILTAGRSGSAPARRLVKPLIGVVP